jgi:uncharacterized Fe-S center protein
MAQVIFTETLFDSGSGEPRKPLIEALSGSYGRGDAVAVKLHMGETNNRTALTPAFVRSIVAALKSIGAEPFLFDSPVIYKSRRDNAESYTALAHERGFTPEFIGCPIHISNDAMPLKGKKAEYFLCRDLTTTDGTLVLTHLKGHLCTGFGGAIKNIGMGAMSKETKGMIHNGGKPIYTFGCMACMDCVEMCPTYNVRMVEDHPEFDKTFCVGCSNCAALCEEGAIKPAIDHFETLLTEATALALPLMGKLLFINCLTNITELCDCVSNSGKLLCDDIGYLISRDICAVERASFDIIKKRAGKDIFFDIHHISPLSHIDRMQSFLGGSKKYSIIEAGL